MSIVNNDIHLEESTEFTVSTHVEGAKKQIYTTRYERNQSLRAAAIRLHGTTCMACGFSFQKVYGDRGKDYIEVHHVKPLATTGEAIDVDPATDLVVDSISELFKKLRETDKWNDLIDYYIGSSRKVRERI